MTIAKTADRSDLPSTGGMSATFPVSPRYAGDNITVNLVANTAGYALSTFNVKVGQCRCPYQNQVETAWN
jgi:hypothetical protein